ncbi:MAG: tetratricopeptide repeat protein [Candidatus Cyclobacteriaceae bacterium M3_2C_046]
MIRIKHITLTFLILITLGAGLIQAQNDRNSPEFQQQAKVYARSMKYNDFNVAKSALYNLIAMQPQNDSLLFSLAYIYFDNRNYISSVLAAKDLLALNPDNLAALEISAISYENIGAKQKALDDYESLYLKNENVNTLYKIAFLQYELNRHKEAKTNAEILLDKEAVADQKLYFSTGENQQQEIPMMASVYNLLGLITKAQGNKTEAKQHFEKAIEVAPEFELAKNNLNELDSN